MLAGCSFLQELVDNPKLRTLLNEDVPVMVDDDHAVDVTMSFAKTTCSACGRSFRKQKQLHKHVRVHHSCGEALHLMDASVRC